MKMGRALHWLIELRESARVVGWVRIARHDADPARGEVGFWLGAAFHRLGYATEAVRAAVRAGFERLGLTVIEGGAQPTNEGSQRVMRHVGMTPSGERQVWASSRQRHEVCIFYEIHRSHLAGLVARQSGSWSPKD
jgi:RimJ/RimL family protein N-acetyltransferase